MWRKLQQWNFRGITKIVKDGCNDSERHNKVGKKMPRKNLIFSMLRAVWVMQVMEHYTK